MSYPRRRKLMFITLSLVYQLVFLQGVVMTTVANDIMRDMDLSPVSMGWLGSAYLYAYAGVMLISGMVAAWLGPRRTLTILFTLSGLGGLLFALSPSFELAVIGRALSGMGMAATMTSSFTIFSRWYAPGDYSRICSVFFAIGGLGTLIGTGPLALATAVWSWRTIFLFVAILTLIYAAATYLAVRDWPPENITRRFMVGDLKRADSDTKMLWHSFRQVAKSTQFWRIMIWFVFLSGTYFTYCGLWAVPYLVDVYGMPHAEAGAIVSLVALGFIVGAPALSAFSDTVLHSYRIPMGFAGIFTAVLFGYTVWQIDSMGRTTLIIVTLLIGMMLNAPNACAYAAARNLFGTRMTGITGGVFGCSAFIGGAFLQILCGWFLNLGLARQWGAPASYALAFTPLIFCGLFAAVAGLTLSKESAPRP